MSKHHKNHEEEKKSSNPFATDETENTVNIEDNQEEETTEE